ncbi:unnamed protein product [Meganyctiphanes norvegica]|uniref:C2H2-type domain-containing protein n=1 Tax=Meganyctiphanes norvegica TaxID=48144 RepID=A0AAV2STI4_MEGNR
MTLEIIPSGPMSPRLPSGPLSPRIRSETPEKKIAIQIRKDYTKISAPSKVSDENMPHRVIFKVPKTPGEMKVESMLTELCDIPKLFCMPCKKTYKSITSLKRHASLHFTWTRFMCQKCNMQTFHRYECVNHAMIQHKLKEAQAQTVVVDHEEVGALKYHLIYDEGTCVSSDAEDSESVSSIHSPVFGKEIENKSLNISKQHKVSLDKVIKKETCVTENIEIEESIDILKKNQVSQDKVVKKDSLNTENIKLEEDKKAKTPDKQKNIEKNTITNTIIESNEQVTVNIVPKNISSNIIQTKVELNSLSNKKDKTINKTPLLSVIQNLKEKVQLEHTNGDSIFGGCIYPIQESVTNTGTNGTSDSDEYKSERPIRNRKSVEKKDFVYDTNSRTSSVVETNVEESAKNISKRKNSFSPTVGNSGKKCKQRNMTM